MYIYIHTVISRHVPHTSILINPDIHTVISRQVPHTSILLHPDRYQIHPYCYIQTGTKYIHTVTSRHPYCYIQTCTSYIYTVTSRQVPHKSILLHPDRYIIHPYYYIQTCTTYCKRITFGDVFFLATLAVESPSKIKYTPKCAFITVRISGYKSTIKSNPR